MKINELLSLTLRGKAIRRTYSFRTNFEELQNECELLITDKSSNPLSLESKKFIGRFYGDKKKNFKFKTNSNFFRKGSLNNLVEVNGTITEENEENCSLQLEFIRSKFLLLGELVMVVFFILLLISVGIKSFKASLGLMVALLPFYIFGKGICLAQVNEQLNYYEKHLINNLKIKMKTKPNKIQGANSSKGGQVASNFIKEK